MIIEINENELFNISVENGINLPEHGKSFSERIGIKMISEDGTNFLQGIASFDYFKNKEIGSISSIWVNPLCVNTNFEEILKENIQKIGIKGLKSKYNSKTKETKKETPKKSAKNAKESKKIKSYVASSELIGKVKCVHLDHTDTSNIDGFKNSNKNFSDFMTPPVNSDGLDEKFEIKTDDSILDHVKKLVSNGNNEADIPAISKKHKSFIYVKSKEDDSFIISESYETVEGLVVKIMNVYVPSELRNKGIASEMTKDLIDYLKNEKINIVLSTVVGSNSLYVESILKKNGFEQTGASRGRIFMGLEL